MTGTATAVRAPAKAGFGKRLRGVATAVMLASSGAAVAAPAPQAAGSMTLNQVRQTLTQDYHYSPEDAERVIKSIEQANPGGKLPITGLMHTSGFDLALIFDSWTWRNVTTTFLDASTGRKITTNCLYDVYYENGGLVASAGYKWVVMVMFGDLNVNQLSGASFGRGVGLSFWFWQVLGLDVQYLPSDNRDASMIVVNPQIGVGGGLRFPRMTFTPAQSCPR